MCNLKWYVALAMVLWSMVQPVKAAPPDLDGAEVVEAGICILSGMPAQCLEVHKGKKRYLVVAPAPQVLFIFEIQEGAVQPYMPNELRQVFPEEDQPPDRKQVRHG